MPEPEYTLTLHRGKYVLTYRTDAGRRRISTGQNDLLTAEIVARRIWEKIHAVRSEQVEDLWHAYVRDRIAKGKDPKRFELTWRSIGPFFGAMIGRDITEADCRAYAKLRKKQGKAPATIVTELSFLRAALKKHYPEGTKLNIWLPPTSPPRSYWITQEQVRQLIEAASSPHIELFITLAAATAARSNAILGLTWDRVDLRLKIADFQDPKKERTNKRNAVVPLNNSALAALKVAHKARLTDHVIEWGGAPVTTVKKALQRLSDKVGFLVSSHVLRHSAAVWMARDGVPIAMISQYLGHSSLEITHRYYAHYHPEHKREAAIATDFNIIRSEDF